MPNSWLVRAAGGLAPRLRLYCFSYAGGSAAGFAKWQAALGPEVEVCAVELPGHGMRRSEAPMTSLQQVVESVAQVIARQGPLPFAFFGHSLGGLLAFETARYCMRHGLALPRHLFASGCSAPQHRSPSRNLHLLEDDALIEQLRDYNGTPAELLAHRELMALVLPLLRADFGLVENYAYRPSPRLPLPITVLAGTTDEHAKTEQVEGWRKETGASCQIEWFDGDHFFIQSHLDGVLACVAQALDMLPALNGACGAGPGRLAA